jgi:hypothetical protein
VKGVFFLNGVSLFFVSDSVVVRFDVLLPVVEQLVGVHHNQ